LRIRFGTESDKFLGPEYRFKIYGTLELGFEEQKDEGKLSSEL